MQFSNLIVRQLTEKLDIELDALEAALEAMAFKPCGPHENSRMGWFPSIDKGNLAHQFGDAIMLCAKTESKVLPASAVNEIFIQKIAELEEIDGWKRSKKERAALKDEIIFELLPKALTVSGKLHAYIQDGFIYIDTASSAKAEEMLSLLRKSLGSLLAAPISTNGSMTGTMTTWVDVESSPVDKFTVGQECELRSPEEGGGIIRCKQQDLSESDVQEHIASGKQVHKLALTWADKISFVIDETFALKKVKFLDILQDDIAGQELETKEQMFNADFLIMQAEFKGLVDNLVTAFGGMA